MKRVSAAPLRDVAQLEERAARQEARERIVHRLLAQLLARGNELMLQLHDARPRPHPGAKLPGVERLGDVVVRAGVEAGDDVLVLIVCCQQDGVDVAAVGETPDRAAHLEPVRLGHRPVDDGQAGAVGAGELLDRLAAVGDGGDLVAPRAQRHL